MLGKNPEPGLLPEELDTVCTECLRVMKKRAVLTCPSCGGKTMYVPAGQGEQAKKEIQARGRGNILD